MRYKLLLILILLCSIKAFSEPRWDAFEIINKRSKNISVYFEFSDYTLENIQTFIPSLNKTITYNIIHWKTEIESDNGIMIEINHSLSELSDDEKIIKPGKYIEVFKFPISPLYEVDKEKHIYYHDVINSIPFIKKLKHILKKLEIFDENNNILFTLETITEIDLDLSDEGSGYLYVY
ncbi:hypothetical protein FACS189485_19880 [Spirochaetia bacterium]|nr:hypothetical protein FACS189485_19880 [Spirochaetia bacterium]